MCWYEVKCEPKVAMKDIKVFKIVTSASEEQCISLFQGHTYETQKCNTPIELIYDVITRTINEGYHSYAALIPIRQGVPHPSEDRVYWKCYNQIISCLINTNRAVAEFIIPKGSVYITNLKGDIVSSNIIYTGNYCNI